MNILGFDCKNPMAKIVNSVKRIPSNTPDRFRPPMVSWYHVILKNEALVMNIQGFSRGIHAMLMGYELQQQKWRMEFQGDVHGVLFKCWWNIIVNINEAWSDATGIAAWLAGESSVWFEGGGHQLFISRLQANQYYRYTYHRSGSICSGANLANYGAPTPTISEYM